VVTLTEREESINGPNNDSKSGVYKSARGGHENLRGELDLSGDIYLAGEKFNLAPGGTEDAEEVIYHEKEHREAVSGWGRAAPTTPIHRTIKTYTRQGMRRGHSSAGGTYPVYTAGEAESSSACPLENATCAGDRHL